MLTLKETLRAVLHERLKDLYPIAPNEIDFLYPPQAKFGDIALSLAMPLAKKLRENPRKIAQKMAGEIGALPGVVRTEVAGAGFINLFLDRDRFFRDRLAPGDRSALRPEEQKIIVEHTNINPNKAAHIGHLRNACLGDTLVRCLRAKGETVEVQNYLDDTGVQVVDVVYGLMELEGKTVADLDRIDKFDYYCWDLYARTAAYLESHPDSRARKAEILKGIEHGRDPEGGMAFAVSRRIVRAHLRTMDRIGATYDVLPCESSILGLKFWDYAFALLKERRAIYFVDAGPNANCWVMKVEDEDDREKIIVRGDGTVTYVGKDIAYQMWKFGLLGRDFSYEPFAEKDGRTVWISTSAPNDRTVEFGNGSRVYNVIDTRQAYLQKVVVQGLRAMQFEAQAEKSVHFSYEMVALSLRSLKYLGIEATAEEQAKGFVEVSGRKGLGVKADDLLDLLERKAGAEVDQRNPEMPESARKRTAAAIARGALRYFMLKYALNSMIVFDVDDALSFEGETGPYLMYTVVRLNSIFRKLAEREGRDPVRIGAEAASGVPPFGLLSEAEGDELWDLVGTAAKFEEEVLHSIVSLEFSHLAKFAFLLSQKVNAYYHRWPVLAEENADIKNIRIYGLFFVRGILEKVLGLMGLEIPERM